MPNTSGGTTFQPISADWLAKPSPIVAPALLGCWLVRRFEDGRVARGLIVETEAYAPTDPACHAYRGKTERNAVMFGPAGYLYVYLIYGIYHCLNVVTDAAGVGSAVLIRAIQLQEIPDWIPAHKQKTPQRVAAGPGLLCQALQIDRSHNGWPLIPRAKQAGIWLEFPSDPCLADAMVQTTRIGLSQGVETPWRWYIRNHPAISRP